MEVWIQTIENKRLEKMSDLEISKKLTFIYKIYGKS